MLSEEKNDGNVNENVSANNTKTIQETNIGSSLTSSLEDVTHTPDAIFNPGTPDFSPPSPIDKQALPTIFNPGTPDFSPPNANEILHEEEELNNKKKQLDILKQTYVDVAKKKINKQKNIFNPVIDTEKVIIMINKVDKNVQTLIHNTLKSKLESKCNRHGLIKEDSIQIINISSASVKGNVAEFYVTYQGLACNPVEGMIVEANIVNITKAGIRAELVNFNKSPIIIFIARDHNNNNNYFNNLREKNTINVKIVGVRYEMNDVFVSVIGELYNFH